MDSKLHICFCLDENWINSARRTIYDIILRKFPETKIKFYVLLDGKLNDKSLFDVFNKIEDIEISVHELDATKMFGKVATSAPWLGSFKHLRFLIPELEIFQDVARVLYLDIDMLARRDLSDLYNVNLDGVALGGVKHALQIGNKDFPNGADKHYEIEPSMLVMNIPTLRMVGFTETCKYLASRPECNGDVWILRNVAKCMAKLLDPKYVIPYHIISAEKKYNDIQNWNLLYDTNYKSISDLVERSYLWHFCGYKPLIYRCMPCVKACFDLSNQRLQRFLETGKVEKWSPFDDNDLYTHHGYIQIYETKKEIKIEKTEPVLD